MTLFLQSAPPTLACSGLSRRSVLGFSCLCSGGSLDPSFSLGFSSLHHNTNDPESAPPLPSKGGILRSNAAISIPLAFLRAPSALSASLRYLLSWVSSLRNFQLSTFNFELPLEPLA
jgi:hypothetical protein